MPNAISHGVIFYFVKVVPQENVIIKVLDQIAILTNENEGYVVLVWDEFWNLVKFYVF